MKTPRILSIVGLIVLLAGILPARANQINLSAELEHKLLPANTDMEAVIKLSIAAPELLERETRKVRVNLSIVLDRSGSMGSSGKLENAKKAAIAALRMLRPDDIYSVITYDNQAEALIPARNANNIRSAESQINSLRTGGSTALYAGISIGANEVRKNLNSGYINRIILLSDGLANVGPGTPAELGRLGSSLIKEGISVSTIGLGNGYNEDLMTALSQNSDGNFYFVENSNDLPLIFSKELGSTLQVAAKAINLHIEFPEGIVPLGVLGHNYKIVDNKMDITFNQVYGGHEKTLIIQVKVPARKPETEISLAAIDMDYQDVLSGKPHQISRRVKAMTSADRRQVEDSRNLTVTKDYLMINNAVLQQKAIEQADKGNWAAANASISKSNEQLKVIAKKTNDEELIRQIKENEMQQEELKKDQRTGKFNSRKVLKGKSYQTINSQMYNQSSSLNQEKSKK